MVVGRERSRSRSCEPPEDADAQRSRQVESLRRKYRKPPDASFTERRLPDEQREKACQDTLMLRRRFQEYWEGETAYSKQVDDDEDKQETLAQQQRDLRDFSVSMPRLDAKDIDLGILPQQVKAALDFLVAIDPRQVVPDEDADKLPKLLPPQQEEHRGRRTLLLDLDETLVHCHCQPTPLEGANAETALLLELEHTESIVPTILRANVYVRPHARQLLMLAATKFEVVIFTASASIYADKVLDFLDPGRKLIAHRLYRESCTEIAGGHFKDIRRIGRPLKDVVLVDNSPLAPGLAPDNGLIVSSWYGDNPLDSELNEVMAIFGQMETLKSIPDYLRQRYGFKAFLQELRTAHASKYPANAARYAAMARMSQLMFSSSSSVVTQVQR